LVMAGRASAIIALYCR